MSAPCRPGFLGIGAPHTGTSWLDRHLRRHPQVWLPPVKELHYWNAQRPAAASYVPPPHPDVRAWAGRWYRNHCRSLLRRAIRLRVSPAWTLRYILGRRSDAWYARLFPRDRLAGEITPDYMVIPPQAIEDVRRLNPAMKIILFLRDPVDRTVSAARRLQGRKRTRGSPEVPDQQVLPGMTSRGVLRRNDYAEAIRNWRAVFGPDQVFIGFYDDLQTAPRDLFRSVLRFLGVADDDRFIPDAIEDVVNPSDTRYELPRELVAQLAATYVGPLRELEQLVGGPVGRWRAAAEQVLAQGIG